MTRSPCVIYTPSHADFESQVQSVDQQGIADRQLRLNLPHPVAGSCCDACGKVLEESESAIRGYASGKELGLCRKCASHVNTTQDINRTKSLGYTVYSEPIHSPAGGSHDGGHAHAHPEI